MIHRRGLVAAAAAALLTACAAPVRTTAPADGRVWAGRLALSVEGRQAQSFSAAFELKGRPEAGELSLFTPLGGIAAVLAWSPGSATLRTGSDLRRFDSLEALALEATGAPLPVAALFDWLAGTATPVPGWQADVTQVADGRLRARREAPAPAVDLRVAIER